MPTALEKCQQQAEYLTVKDRAMLIRGLIDKKYGRKLKPEYKGGLYAVSLIQFSMQFMKMKLLLL